MKRLLFFLAAAMLLVPAFVFAGGEQEAAAEETKATAATGVTREYPFVDTSTGKIGTVTIAGFREAPMLAERVAKGELPPVDQRVPQDPLVLQPVESIGKYGGTVVMNRDTQNPTGKLWRILWEFPLNYSIAFLREIYPNVLKQLEMGPEAKKFTFYLRKGMKWSDGEPFTADDVIFWYEDQIKNDTLFPAKPAIIAPGGNLGLVRKIDSLTVEFVFDDPNPIFEEEACRWRPPPYEPAHYLKQFHPKYTSQDEINKKMRDEGFDTWGDYYQQKGASWTALGDWEKPVIWPWKLMNDPTEAILVIERNPYFWKVDTEGNQLPYVDRQEQTFIADTEAALLQIMAGETTYAQGGYVGGRQNLPILLQNREKGNYRITTYIWPPNCHGSVLLNYTHEDPVLRELFLDKRFRIALSVARDRDEINQAFYDGDAIPSQPTTSRGAPFYGYSDPMFKRYTEHDPDLANRMLDEMGLTARDNDGYRLRPDGKKLVLSIMVATRAGSSAGEMAELDRQNWEKIGIRVVIKVTTGPLMTAARTAGQYDMELRSSLRNGPSSISGISSV